MLARSNKGTWLPVLLSLGVKGVRVVIAHKDELRVRVNTNAVLAKRSSKVFGFFIFHLENTTQTTEKQKPPHGGGLVGLLIHPVIGW